MVAENQKSVPEESISEVSEENTSKIPPDSELFAGHVQEKLSAQEIFAGDEDFYKSLAKPEQTTTATAKKLDDLNQPPISAQYTRFSTLQKILAASIILIAAILLYALLKPPSMSAPGPASTQTDQTVTAAAPASTQTDQTITATISAFTQTDQTVTATDPASTQTDQTVTATAPSKPPTTNSAQTEYTNIQESEPTFETTEPLSLKVAQTFYLNRDYDKAYTAFEKLRQNLPESSDEDSIMDFFELKKALCLKKTTNYKQAGRLFRMASKSSSPIISVVANYNRSLLEMQKKQYLNARTRAYQAIALLDTIGFDKGRLLALEQDCHFLAAEAVTKKVLSLSDTDKNLPEDLWSNFGDASEVFADLDESQLRAFLNSGSNRLNRALLGPKIQVITQKGGSPRYTITSHKTPIEELLARFAVNAGLDIHWALDLGEIGIRKRAVNLHISAATTQQLATVTAGCAGLLAQMDEKNDVNITNPANYQHTSEYISMLNAEAVSLWQKFLLRFLDSPRIANTHFIIAVLQAQKGLVNESIAEYKLIANRFPRSSLAPFALLNSSKLKADLHDNSGVREDLKQLVEQYPDTEIAGQAYLYLADTTAEAGFNTEAERLYHKVYNLNLSSESQSIAALRAGKCSYQIKDYESATKWLTRYIESAKDPEDKDISSAYFFLGKTNQALGESEASCEAFQYALAGQLAREEQVEAISALVEEYMEQKNFVEALNVLENTYTWQFSQKESIKILLLKSRVFRSMGLVDKAITALRHKAEYLSDQQLKAKISFEMANCYLAKEDLNRAREKLIELLIDIEPGPLACNVALKLADVCLKLDEEPQAISVCSQLLKLNPPEQTRQKALVLMATACNRQKNYDRAALALLDQWK